MTYFSAIVVSAEGLIEGEEVAAWLDRGGHTDIALVETSPSAIHIIAMLRERIPSIKCGIIPQCPRAEPRRGPGVSLTDREADVLTFLAKGVGYANIAALLGIRLGTVQNHIKRLYAKLDVNTKAEAAVAAMNLGLV